MTQLIDEYAVCARKPDGTLRYAGRWYDTYKEAKQWFDYLRGDWRKSFIEEVEEEKRKNRGNMLQMSWKDKKDEKFLIITRQVSKATIVLEEDEFYPSDVNKEMWDAGTPSSDPDLTEDEDQGFVGRKDAD